MCKLVFVSFFGSTACYSRENNTDCNGAKERKKYLLKDQAGLVDFNNRFTVTTVLKCLTNQLIKNRFSKPPAVDHDRASQ